jgi:hypothetical protein
MRAPSVSIFVLAACVAAGCSVDPLAGTTSAEPDDAPARAAADEPDDPTPAGGAAALPLPGEADPGNGPLTFATPRKGAHVELTASPALTCPLRVASRAYDFPAGAEGAAVSMTGKTMCFTQSGTIHCHVSGTETGLCYDTVDNVVNALTRPATRDGDFLRAYVAAHPGQRRNVSGHSQGAYDASRVAPLLGAGDQLILLQPASSALLPNGALLGASERGARVYVAWSPNDNASLGIRSTAGPLPLIELPLQEVERVHNAPNARDQFLRWFAIEEGRTPNPALDASILSNPGSPLGSWRSPAWRS